MNYFKSYYSPCAYSPNWYGTLDYAPMATVLMYNDEDCYCIGHMEADDANVNYITEEEAMDIIDSEEGEHVWKGDRLTHRWDKPAIAEVGEVDGEI